MDTTPPRRRFIAALERRPLAGPVPHFELVFYPTRYALRHGMPGGGYIFSTSNCIYPGVPLARYEQMLDVWRAEGNYLEEERADGPV